MRYCVDVIHEVLSPMDNEMRHTFDSHFFESFDKARLFRKWCLRKGIKVSNVMDLQNLPF